MIAQKGRYGPYIKYGDKNISLPKGVNPLSVSLEQCINLIVDQAGKPAENAILAQWEASDISIINGRYGPYIKHAGSNFRIPKGTDPATLTEQMCMEIIGKSTPTAKSRGRFVSKKK